MNGGLEPTPRIEPPGQPPGPAGRRTLPERMSGWETLHEARVTMGRVEKPWGGRWETWRAAGFNSPLESHVRRTGWPENFTQGGHWKNSSFLGRGPQSSRLAPGNSNVHPALWPLEPTRTTDTFVRTEPDAQVQV